MQAVVQVRTGEPCDALSLVNLPSPQAPSSGEVLVKIIISPVHHGDLFMTRITGTVDGESLGVPRGSEAFGIIEAIGPNVSAHLSVGARVAIFPAFGAWCERLTVGEESVVLVPDVVSDEIASMALVNAITARMVVREMIKQIDTRKRTAIVTAAGSAVAKLISLFAAQEGFELIGLVRRPAAVEELKRHFPSMPVFSTDKPNWQESVAAALDDRQTPIIADCVGGAFVESLIPLLKPGGTIVTYGGLHEGPIGMSSLELTASELCLKGVSIARWHENTTPEQRAEDLSTAMKLVSSHPHLFEVAGAYDLREFRDAVLHVEQGGKNGAVLFHVSPLPNLQD